MCVSGSASEVCECVCLCEMPSDCAPRHSYLKLALVTNTRLRGCEIPAGAERTFLLETATAFARGDVRVSGVSGVSGVGGVGGVSGVFPVQQPRSFRRRQLSEFAHQKLLVSLKTDGVRYLLLLTRYAGEPRAVLIDRSMAVREIEVWANDDFFDGTLVDGELVAERNVCGSVSDLFLAFDLYAIRGSALRSRVYSDRIGELFNILLSPSDCIDDVEELTNAVTEGRKICAAPDTCLRIVSKAVMCATYTAHVWEQRGASSHMNDGLIFTPDVAVDLVCPSYVLKWKPLNTIDVMLLVTKNKSPSILVRHSTVARVTNAVDMGEGRKLRFVLDSNVILESLIEQGHVRFVVECACLIKGSVVFITPIRPRLDKDAPNHIHVVKETLHNVMENLEIREIIDALRCAAPLVPFMPSSPPEDAEGDGDEGIDCGGVCGWVVV